MYFEILKHMEKSLANYSAHPDYNIVEAKEVFFELTGSAHEEDEEFEQKMNCFNDWYVLQYIPKHITTRTTVIHEYVAENSLGSDLIRSLSSFNHSIFELKKINRQDQIVLDDLLHRRKIILAPNHPTVALVEEDIFVGRTVACEEGNYLFKGLCILPRDTKTLITKQAKKIHKLEGKEEELKFLLYLEFLNTKRLRYGHVDAKKIFQFGA